MESQLKANRVEIANRQQEIKEVQAKIGQYQARLNMAPVMEQQFADITRDYDQSKADYETLLKKKNESEMATDLEKTEQGEHFRMLDPPNLPVKPFKPKRLLFCAGGLAAGILLGSGPGAGTGEIEREGLQRARNQEAGAVRNHRGNSAHRNPGGATFKPAWGLGGGGGGAGGGRMYSDRVGSDLFVRIEIKTKSCIKRSIGCSGIRLKLRRIRRSCFQRQGTTRRWRLSTTA